jgi:DNA-binding NtrC family response regulator
MEQKRFLVVDDEVEIRTILKAYLELKGYEVTLAKDGNEAVSFLSGGVFDVVISDYLMPNLDGLKLTTYMKDAKLSTPIIWVSGNADQRLFRQGWSEGLFDFIEKPINFELLQELIDRALAFGIHYSKNKRGIG